MLHVRLPLTAILIGLVLEFTVSMPHVLIPVTFISGAVSPRAGTNSVSHAVGILCTYILAGILVGILLVLCQGRRINSNRLVYSRHSELLDDSYSSRCSCGREHLLGQTSLVTSSHRLHRSHGLLHRLLRLWSHHGLLHGWCLLWLRRRNHNGFTLVDRASDEDILTIDLSWASGNTHGGPWMQAGQRNGDAERENGA